MDRRGFLFRLAALCAIPGWARAADAVLTPSGDGQPFSHEAVVERARRMAAEAYRPRPQVPRAWRDLTYDQYRRIWFDARNALWTDTEIPFRMDVFPPGLYYPRAVALSVVEDGVARDLAFDLAAFDRTDDFPDLPVDETLGYSGLRLRSRGEEDIFREFAVFQGASYFRAIGTGQIYGLSARGLAVDTAEPGGEEFPEFVHFWIERPSPAADRVTLHALLDSPGVTGAYRFEIEPGLPVRMDVSVRIFSRRELPHYGLAPLTSMFLFDGMNRHRFDDFRPAVHDSDGLLIRNGAGETLWRPLANPVALQTSSFLDEGPKGFGLMQRARRYRDFADLEALYHRRPGLWVEPGEDWRAGAVTLVEIPTDREVFDNIVAYWRPREALPRGAERAFTYRLRWGEEPPPSGSILRVLDTRMGGRPEGGKIVLIDFQPGPQVPEALDQIDKQIRTSSGGVSDGVLQRNPETGGPRLAFTFYPDGRRPSELRAQLRLNGGPLSEVWLYRWTPDA